MPVTYVLVHGAWHGGWCYARVAEILRAQGHRVFTPTMTGLGERAHLANPYITLSDHVTDIVNVLRYEDLQLCCVVRPHLRGSRFRRGGSRAHGSGAGVSHALCPRRRLAAKSLTRLQRARQNESAEVNGGDIAPIPAVHFNVNENDRAYVDSQCVPQPLETMRERLVLTGARERVAHKTYLRAGRTVRCRSIRRASASWTRRAGSWTRSPPATTSCSMRPGSWPPP